MSNRVSQQLDAFQELMASFDGPFTARVAETRARQLALNLSRPTLFRRLQQALDTGELLPVPHLGGDRVFERRRDHHHHQVCPTCDRVEDAAEPCLHRCEPAPSLAHAVLAIQTCQPCQAEGAA